MACPFFDPTAPFSYREWPDPPRMPLGDPHSGVCTASGSPSSVPPVKTCCNTGYARGQCASFPGGDAPDAVRFGILSHQAGAASVQYVVERDHHPFSHGILEIREAAEGPSESLLERQARAYLASYLRRNS